ncbi:hypothetical protein P3G55_18880 [Leptospira sp. 96542]|nr:hypothetical protein [Leptospira sp. 96542]
MKYTAVSVVTLPEDAVLGLSEQQAKARAHALSPMGKGRYKTKAPVHFKVGEVFVYEGELPKVLASSLEPVEAERKRKPAQTADAAAQALAQQREALAVRLAELNQALDAAQTEMETDALVKQIEAAEAELAALG